jgi:hypothetical protein
MSITVLGSSSVFFLAFPRSPVFFVRTPEVPWLGLAVDDGLEDPDGLTD